MPKSAPNRHGREGGGLRAKHQSYVIPGSIHEWLQIDLSQSTLLARAPISFSIIFARSALSIAMLVVTSATLFSDSPGLFENSV